MPPKKKTSAKTNDAPAAILTPVTISAVEERARKIEECIAASYTEEYDDATSDLEARLAKLEKAVKNIRLLQRIRDIEREIYPPTLTLSLIHI